jgi:hypothetical protein
LVEQVQPIAEAPQAINLSAAKSDPEALFDRQDQLNLAAGVESGNV